MRKIISPSVIAVLLAASILPTLTYAQDAKSDTTTDTESTTEKQNTFGFTADASIEVTETTDTSVTLSFKAVDTLDGEKAYTYAFLYTTEPSVIKADPASVKEVSYNVLDESENISFDVIADMAKITITDLQPDTTYSMVVVPRNASDVDGSPSAEVEVKTTASSTTTDTENTQGAAEDVVALNNPAYYQEGSNVYLTWEAVGGDYEVEILFGKIGGTPEPIGKVAASAGKYGPIAITEAATYDAQLTMYDNITSDRQGPTRKLAVKIDSLEKVQQPKAQANPIKKVPTVGTTTNIIIALLIIATLIYVMQRYRKEDA